MQNPWLDLPLAPPYVLPQDQPILEAWNHFADERHALDLGLLPSPWVGRLDAPVIVLNLNPGLGDTDHEWEQREELASVVRACLREESVDYPVYPLDPALAESGGGKWWRRCLGQLIRDTNLEVVANRVLGLEFHGYHSRQFAGLPVTLPSQAFVFEVLREALAREAVVFVMRGPRFWAAAVPELVAYHRRFSTVNPQSSSISRRNSVDRHAYDAVLTALTS